MLAEVAWSLAEGLAARSSSRCWRKPCGAGLIQDGVIAASEAQRKALWALRENPTEAMAHEGVVLRHDIAVPVSRVPDLIAQRRRSSSAARCPACGSCRSAIVGDGNIHYNLLQPADMAGRGVLRQTGRGPAAWCSTWSRRSAAASAPSTASAGSSAPSWRARKSPVELALMRQLKATLDPKGILNPGAVI